MGEVLASIGGAIEGGYNEKRLHSAANYRSPSEFERVLIVWVATVHGHCLQTTRVILRKARERALPAQTLSQVSRPFVRIDRRSIARRLGDKNDNRFPHRPFVTGSPEFREAGAGGMIARWLRVLNKFGFALGGAVGQFEAEGSWIEVPYPGVDGVLSIPMLQQALSNVSFAHDHFAFFVLDGIDALGVRNPKLNP
jgi:hypothetical protein